MLLAVLINMTFQLRLKPGGLFWGQDYAKKPPLNLSDYASCTITQKKSCRALTAGTRPLNPHRILMQHITRQQPPWDYFFPMFSALRAVSLFQGENELWGLTTSENKQWLICPISSASQAAPTSHQRDHLPGAAPPASHLSPVTAWLTRQHPVLLSTEKPLRKREAPILLQIGSQEKQIFKDCSHLWGLTKRKLMDPRHNNHYSFSAQDIRDMSLGNLKNTNSVQFTA